MIVDSSALLAIILNEAERVPFATAIAAAAAPRMSAASYVEVGLRLDRFEHGLDPELDTMIAELRIEIVDLTLAQARIAREAAIRFGRGHLARLNFGDCLTYALAKSSGEPLLFKGNDFGLTDLKFVAVPGD